MEMSDFNRRQPVGNLIYWFYLIGNSPERPQGSSERQSRLSLASNLAANFLAAGTVYLSINALMFIVYLVQNALSGSGLRQVEANSLTQKYLSAAMGEVMEAGRGVDLEAVLAIFGVFATLLVAVAFMDLQNNSNADNSADSLTGTKEARVGAAVFNALDILALALCTLCLNLIARNFYSQGLYDWMSLFSFNSLCSIMIAATVCILMVGVREGDLGISSRVSALSRKVKNLTEEEALVTGFISSFPARGRGYFVLVLSGAMAILLIAYFSAVDWLLLLGWLAALMLWVIWLAFFEASFPSWKVTGVFIGRLLKVLSTTLAYSMSLYLSLLTVGHHKWWKNGLAAKWDIAENEVIALGALAALCAMVWVVIFLTSEWVHRSSLRSFEFLNVGQERIRSGLVEARQQINTSREYLREG